MPSGRSPGSTIDRRPGVVASVPGRRRPTRRDDLPWLVVLVAVVVLVGVMVFGPLQRLRAANARVDALTTQRDALAAEVTALEERRDQLQDPDEIELRARREFGMVRPGEQAYVVVPDGLPDDAEPAPEPDADERPWYRRLVDALTGG